MKYHGIIISDIHFGAIDPIKLKEELEDGFIYFLENMKKIDFIVITGDYFDHKIYLNDKTSDYAFGFMDNLVKIAKRNRCPIRIIYGTESHEVNQYNIFNTYEKDKDTDFKIIKRVEEEELLEDLWVLYLPEEFMLSKKEYYEEFFNNKNKYNYIFGHGIIQEVMTDAVKNTHKEKENKREKVPVFTTSELLSICKGQVYFGHYHMNVNINDRIFYVGSFTRWKHGEPNIKGFYHIMYNRVKDEYVEEFIENTLAPKYITYNYGYNSHVMDSEKALIDELNKRDKLTRAINGDHIKYVFNIPENHPNPEFIMNILNQRYKNHEFIKVDIKNGYISKKRKIDKESLNKVIHEFSLVFDKSVQLEDKVVYYIRKKYNREIPLESVKKHLYGGEET